MRSISAALVLAAALSAQNPDIHTSRSTSQVLPLPKTEDAFGFVIFGDRTGGPVEGIEVLEQAVVDTNLLDPDLVMTVGDLINGYNEPELWLEQMREYRETMGRLDMSWFPVAGNHDVYYRGENPPPEEHEGRYETHFGPLWYAFEHKQCWFIVLYSDEGNPETGLRSFTDPASQRMSPEQFGWLQETLAEAKDARHVFVFLHHPRWLGEDYGDDWEKVHQALAAAGNVTAVFAGHIHAIRYDGVRDGIEYFTLAATGAYLSHEIARAGYLHHFNVVTVRPDRISVATIPVGGVLDPREITGEVSDQVADLDSELRVVQVEPLAMPAGPMDAVIEVEVTNPIARSIEVTLTPASADSRWRFEPDHTHLVLPGNESRVIAMRVVRPSAAIDEAFAAPRWRIGCDYLGEKLRIAMPEREVWFALDPPAGITDDGTVDLAMLFGGSTALAVPGHRFEVPDGPFTCEGWLRAEDFANRTGFISKAESSEFGLFVSDGKPEFFVHLDGSYVSARVADVVLEPGRWHHVAGVFDGAELRLYVDGRLVASERGAGVRTTNDLPLMVGADVGGAATPNSFFEGAIDDVRISKVARYAGARFDPESSLSGDVDTLLLLHMNRRVGVWIPDASPAAAHAAIIGPAVFTEVMRDG